MNKFVQRVSSLSCLVAVLVSITTPLVLSDSGVGTAKAQSQQRTTDITAAKASFASGSGVLVGWQVEIRDDNLGFNVYRIGNGQRLKVNRKMILGSAFAPRRPGNVRSSYSFSFLDQAGTADSIYEIESVNIDGGVSLSEPVKAVNTDRGLDQYTLYREVSESQRPDERSFPAAAPQGMSVNGPIEQQWEVASQPGVKISIKRDGWYKVTQQQIAATGFNAVVDIKNLRLFADGREVELLTSKSAGPFGSGDSFEFFGRGIDVSTTDTRIYYLIAGATPGRRVRGDLRISREVSAPPAPLPVANPAFLVAAPESRWFGYVIQFLNLADFRSELPTTKPAERPPAQPLPQVVAAEPEQVEQPSLPKRKITRSAKKKKRTKPQLSHAPSAAAATSFGFTVERKERFNLFLSVLNGDKENYYGPVVGGTPVTQTLNTPNPELTADGPARLEVALQGVLNTPHQVAISFNDVPVGELNFFGLDQAVKVLDVPISALNNGTNSVRLTTIAGGISLIDYVRLTYPHAMRADGDAVRLSLRPNQTVTVHGFTNPNIRLIDVTDPFAVTVSRPVTEPSSGGFAIQIPSVTSRAKARVLYAQLDTQADTPAAFSLNEPSTLNLETNAADLVIIAHKSLMGSVAPLVSLRQSQLLAVSVVDIEDIYDEFDYGLHGPKAIKNFLARTATSWSTKPRYAILLGDATHDPRNYEGLGNFDLVPTKLVDATYDETASDEWLSDFNDDGIGEVALGRLPARTMADANLMIAKIVNFLPANVPQSALLVADDPTGYYFDFEQANSEVQALLPPTLTVQRVDRRTTVGGDAQARANIVAHFNAGQTLVNYTGHGTVDSWRGIFSFSDATSLTNSNKLPFVVVMDCLNGRFQDPQLTGIAEALMKAQNGGSVAAFASSGLTIPDGPHAMANQLYTLLFATPSMALGDAIKISKAATTDIDVRHTWIFFGDPSMKLR